MFAPAKHVLIAAGPPVTGCASGGKFRPVLTRSATPSPFRARAGINIEILAERKMAFTRVRRLAQDD